MKEKIINYIETLEAKSLQVDDYFKQRNELYISNQEKDKEIERLNNTIKGLDNTIENLEEVIKHKDSIIKEAREYIENNDLYEQDYDYDYEENLVVGPPSDETARKILLGILDKEVN